MIFSIKMLFAKHKLKSYSLVALQFSAIAYFLISKPPFCNQIILILIELSGICLGIWAIYAMGSGNLNILPELKGNARLIIKGPYQIIRHPMYAAILLTLLPLLINYFSFTRLFVFLLLITDLVYKLHWEEKILLERFPAYKDYQQKSKRLIPFVY